jgi:nicotinamidase-related amidase
MHPVNLPSWLPERAIYAFDEISPKNTALLVIDMQVLFVEEGQPATSPYSSAIVPNINRLAAALRDAGGVVAFTRHTVVDEGSGAMPEWHRSRPIIAKLDPYFRAGTREHDLDGSMGRRANDIVVDKYRASAFTHNSSSLHNELQARNIDTVIVTGVVTNCCCETSARDANMLGYKTFFIKDGTAAYTDEEHNAALLSLGIIFADLRTTDEMIALIRRAPA